MLFLSISLVTLRRTTKSHRINKITKATGQGRTTEREREGGRTVRSRDSDNRWQAKVYCCCCWTNHQVSPKLPMLPRATTMETKRGSQLPRTNLPTRYRVYQFEKDDTDPHCIIRPATCRDHRNPTVFNARVSCTFEETAVPSTPYPSSYCVAPGLLGPRSLARAPRYDVSTRGVNAKLHGACVKFFPSLLNSIAVQEGFPSSELYCTHELNCDLLKFVMKWAEGFKRNSTSGGYIKKRMFSRSKLSNVGVKGVEVHGYIMFCVFEV